MDYCIINVKIYIGNGDIIDKGYIHVVDGKINEIGLMSGFEYSGEIIDKSGNILIPGLIDAHTHVGIIGDSCGFEGNDLNETTSPCNAQLRAIDAVNPFDRYFEDAYKSGVTTIVTGPGSANPVSGQLLAMKTYGTCVDNMVLSEPCGIKFSLGENPKSVYHSKNETPETRMAIASIIRNCLQKAKEYGIKKDEAIKNGEEMPDLDHKNEALLKLLRGEVKAHFHVHRADDIMTAVRIAKEYGFKFILVHCTDGYKITNDMTCAGVTDIFAGPIINDRSKPELRNLNDKNASMLTDAGFDVSIITDHPEVPIQYLRLSGMICIKNGLKKDEALKCLTINPANALGLSDRVGSLEKGKDADFVLLNGEPFDFYSDVLETYIDGKCVFSK